MFPGFQRLQSVGVIFPTPLDSTMFGKTFAKKVVVVSGPRITELMAWFFEIMASNSENILFPEVKLAI